MTYEYKVENPRLARLYRNVSPEQIARLQSFRQRYPYRAVEIQGMPWPYIDAGDGEQALFLLAGGTAVAELSFQTIEHLAQRYRVIAPDYPPLGNVRAMFDGYIELLDRLGVDHFYLMGGSYGGWMAQSFVRHSPKRIEKVVISAVGPPNPENSRQIARLLPLLRIVPTFLLRALVNRSFSRLLGDADDTQEWALAVALLQEIMRTRVGRADFMALLERLVDQTEHYAFSSRDLQAWPGQILLLFGSDDPATPPNKREAMQKLYPQAEVRVFQGADHTFALSHQKEYFEAADRFLAGDCHSSRYGAADAHANPGRRAGLPGPVWRGLP